MPCHWRIAILWQPFLLKKHSFPVFFVGQDSLSCDNVLEWYELHCFAISLCKQHCALLSCFASRNCTSLRTYLCAGIAWGGWVFGPTEVEELQCHAEWSLFTQSSQHPLSIFAFWPHQWATSGARSQQAQIQIQGMISQGGSSNNNNNMFCN